MRGLLIIGLVTLVGCSEPDCPSEVVVTIASPRGEAAVDVSPLAGFQSDVRIRSNLQAGDVVTLQVVDGAGVAGETIVGESDGLGQVTFPAVTLPLGQIELVVAGASDCGDASTRAMVIVGGLGCTIGIAEGSTTSGYYQSAVVNTLHDADPIGVGFQGTVEVTTSPGFAVSVVGRLGSDIPLGEVTAAADGIAAVDVVLVDGIWTLEATCTSPAGPSLAADELPLVVDTVAPTCSFTPAIGTTITPADDIDGAAAGTQVTLAGQVDGDDVAGERATFTVAGDMLLTPALDADGATSAVATFDGAAGNRLIQLEAQDHAGNPCTASGSYTWAP